MTAQSLKGVAPWTPGEQLEFCLEGAWHHGEYVRPTFQGKAAVVRPLTQRSGEVEVPWEFLRSPQGVTAITPLYDLVDQGWVECARPADAPLASQTAVVKDGVVVGHLGPALSAHQSAQASKVYGLLRDHCPEALTHLSPEDHARQLVTLTLQGEKFVLWDIGMRMLTPRELYRCQGFDDRYVIDFSVKGRPLSKDSQTRMCGNSVPPRMVSALIGAQFSQPMSEAAD